MSQYIPKYDNIYEHFSHSTDKDVLALILCKYSLWGGMSKRDACQDAVLKYEVSYYLKPINVLEIVYLALIH